MFTYIDPTVRERLEAAGTLFRIPRSGGGTISVLGPIPMPLHVGGKRIELQWYATVRNTELTRLEDLAADLRARHGERSFAELASSMRVDRVSLLRRLDYGYELVASSVQARFDPRADRSLRTVAIAKSVDGELDTCRAGRLHTCTASDESIAAFIHDCNGSD